MDHEAGDLPVFESGSVLMYLAERDPQHRLLPADPRGRAEAVSWLFWQMVGDVGTVGQPWERESRPHLPLCPQPYVRGQGGAFAGSLT